MDSTFTLGILISDERVVNFAMTSFDFGLDLSIPGPTRRMIIFIHRQFQ